MDENLLSVLIGLSESDIAKATATTSDVIAGKTFYAGDKEIKTGTLLPHGYTIYIDSVDYKYGASLKVTVINEKGEIEAKCYIDGGNSSSSNPSSDNAYMFYGILIYYESDRGTHAYSWTVKNTGDPVTVVSGIEGAPKVIESNAEVAYWYYGTKMNMVLTR